MTFAIPRNALSVCVRETEGGGRERERDMMVLGY